MADRSSPISQANQPSSFSRPEVADQPQFAPPEFPGELGLLGPYRILKLLGEGGMGAVYLALDNRLNRRLALKVMLPQYAADVVSRERFLREAHAAAQLSHDNIVTIFEADERDGIPYIAMQFLQGQSLDDLLKQQNPLSVGQTLRIAKETAAGLTAAHAVGLVHRDIKPANLWLEAPLGRVKVLDFGLAKPVSAQTQVTQSGVLVGTPAYMSPEQARGLTLDARSDLFSLGAVMYRLLAGRLPFEGPNIMSVLMALGTEEPRPLRECNATVPPEVEELVHELLAKNPNQRPQSAELLRKRLSALGRDYPDPTQPRASGPLDPAAALLASQPQVVYVPIPVNPTPETANTISAANPFEDIELTEPDPRPVAPVPTPIASSNPSLSRYFVIGLALLLVLGVTGILILKSVFTPSPKAEPTDTKPTFPKTEPTKSTPPTLKVEPKSNLRKGVEQILSAGGTVQINRERKDLKQVAELPVGTDWQLTAVNLQTITQPGDSLLMGLANARDLKTLFLRGESFTNVGLAALPPLNDLQNLGLDYTKIEASGLDRFRGVSTLQHLSLIQMSLTDASLANFSQSTELHLLNLNSTGISDQGLQYFKNTNRIVYLYLVNCTVTPEGLKLLSKNTGLLNLDVRGTKITKKDLAELQKLFPLAQIDHDNGTAEPLKKSP